VGSACPADINGDGQVSGTDLTQLLAGWGSTEDAVDLNNDGTVDGLDLASVLAGWGPCN
jgi:hypothetical protein